MKSRIYFWTKDLGHMTRDLFYDATEKGEYITIESGIQEVIVSASRVTTEGRNIRGTDGNVDLYIHKNDAVLNVRNNETDPANRYAIITMFVENVFSYAENEWDNLRTKLEDFAKSLSRTFPENTLKEFHTVFQTIQNQKKKRFIRVILVSTLALLIVLLLVIIYLNKR
ncbi:MAG: hypothetical protein LHW45_07815 [Candidatus Cloacimonetes bacterium]|nr:hypothetical protein [Candidatus Cloacimonadota bacterium]MDY0367517.1 hypothetical protein [Candidatus Syntrophosphaera sp.]